ncbi:MAG: PD40 domain-containing protein, partial [Actinobacteria bacterium]|nr:PD40 domain-containing protein [Actinomycetota bacterium]
MDVDTIEPGVDFAEVLGAAVGSCEVLLAIIGDHWLTMEDDTGRRRLENPDDFVRLEIGAALDRNVRVIPVLVQGAEMPAAKDLPAALAKLTRRNALELSDTRWGYDVGRLVGAVERVMSGERENQGLRSPEPQPHAHVEQRDGGNRAASRSAPGDARPVADRPGTSGRSTGESRPVGDRPPSSRRSAVPNPKLLLTMVMAIAVVAAGTYFLARDEADEGNGVAGGGGSAITNTKIAFLSGRDGDCQVSVINADGTQEQLLTHSSSGKTRPDWSPDGSQILFASDEKDGYDIYVADADGGPAARLTNDPAVERGADWSPDSREIVFSRDDGNSEIWAMDADGGGARRLTNLKSHSVGPDWSESGQIAFSSDRDGDADIYVMNEQGGDLVNVTGDLFGGGESDEFDPSWGPDGRLTFDVGRDGSNFDIYLMNSTEEDPINLTSHPAQDRFASWSPDGTKIAFSTDRVVASAAEPGCAPDEHPYDLFMMNSDGSDQAEF